MLRRATPHPLRDESGLGSVSRDSSIYRTKFIA